MADKVAVENLKLTDLSTKYGLVTIRTAEGVDVRQYKISAEEAERIRNNQQRVPSGCTNEEWEDGLSYMATICLEPGQAVVWPDGTLLACTEETYQNEKLSTKLFSLQPTEFSISGKTLSLDSALKAQVDVAPTKLPVDPVVKG